MSIAFWVGISIAFVVGLLLGAVLGGCGVILWLALIIVKEEPLP